MEVAIIDWKSIESRFVKDEVYEHINAPKWVDFSAPDDPVDDDAWFCRPIADSFKEEESTPTSISKLQRSASVSDIPPLCDRNKRDATLKKRGINRLFASPNNDTKYNSVLEDGENHDPNYFSTPRNHNAKARKEVLESSTEKKQIKDTIMRKEQTPKLKMTLSARNLFSGGDLLNKVAEFCNDMKKLATRARERENSENVNGNDAEKQEGSDDMDDNSVDLNDKEKERKPLLELRKGKSEVMETAGSKGKQRRKKKNDDAENTPISVDAKNIKCQEAEDLLQIRTCPPTPQCLSASSVPPKTTTPKAFRSRPRNREKGILQELKQINKENRVEREEKSNHGREVLEKERTLDVFWFLKPCTLSS
ncbi:hypothetical protein Pfo_001683 [Paulownia fortunei]|nr:hypothetical protein Pfo_001683 [Paulownia fortunei]